MVNIINITEHANRLDFTNTYTPIVCGNSNYLIHFTFDSYWQKCPKKTAVFVVEGKRLMVDFESTDVRVPVLPNAPCVFVSLLSGEGENQVATTAIKIRLEPSPLGGDLSEFDQLASYLPKVYAAINSLQNGDIVSKKAEESNFSSSSNFANVSKTAENVSNPNLLINGDFKINQRGKSVADYDSYFVDRWKTRYNNPAFAIISQNADKTIHIESLNEMWPYLIQIIDSELTNQLVGKVVTMSIKVKNYLNNGANAPQIAFEMKTGTTYTTISWKEFASDGVYTLSVEVPAGYENLVVRTSCSPYASYDVEWVKLEIGSIETGFVPKLSCEELLACQRYYQKFKDSEGTASNPSFLGTFYSVSSASGYMLIDLITPMRVVPTRITETLTYKYLFNDAQYFTRILSARNDDSVKKLKLYGEGSFVAGTVYPVSIFGEDSYLELDAEIY